MVILKALVLSLVVTLVYGRQLLGTKIRVVMRWQRSFALSRDNTCQNWESVLEHFMRQTTYCLTTRHLWLQKKEIALIEIFFFLLQWSMTTCLRVRPLSLFTSVFPKSSSFITHSKHVNVLSTRIKFHSLCMSCDECDLLSPKYIPGEKPPT